MLKRLTWLISNRSPPYLRLDAFGFPFLEPHFYDELLSWKLRQGRENAPSLTWSGTLASLTGVRWSKLSISSLLLTTSQLPHDRVSASMRTHWSRTVMLLFMVWWLCTLAFCVFYVQNSLTCGELISSTEAVQYAASVAISLLLGYRIPNLPAVRCSQTEWVVWAWVNRCHSVLLGPCAVRITMLSRNHQPRSFYGYGPSGQS